jgi:hypothetical protein
VTREFLDEIMLERLPVEEQMDRPGQYEKETEDDVNGGPIGLLKACKCPIGPVTRPVTVITVNPPKTMKATRPRGRNFLLRVMGILLEWSVRE